MFSFFQHPRTIHSNRNISSLRELLSNRRRFNTKFIFEFSNLIIALWLFAFGVRFGSLWFLLLTGFIEPEKAESLHMISLPYSIHNERIENKRLQSYLCISLNGQIKFNGLKLDENKLLEQLIQKRIEIPEGIITIIADKDCEMENILSILEILQRADTRQIFFLTNIKEE